jgi:hypothetical protein
MLTGTQQVYEMETIQAGRSRFQRISAHTDCKVIVLYILEGNNSCELKVLMYKIYVCKILLL